MNFSIQPNLENDFVQVLPLEINDFEGLYQVAKIYFHIGSTNFRSQKAIAKINAIKTSREIIVTDGNSSYINYLYELIKENWR